MPTAMSPRETKRRRGLESLELAAFPTSSRRSHPTTRFSGGGMHDLVMRSDLFFGAFLQFLDAEEIARVCEALSAWRGAQYLLHDENKWMYLMHRDGLVKTEDADANATQQLSRRIVHTVQCNAGCAALRDYVSLLAQWRAFVDGVVIVAGDLEAITRIGSTHIDCLAFPTSGTFRNPGVGVSGCIHRRAGPELNVYVASHPPSHIYGAGNVLTTPGFQSGVRLLVHCVGPAFNNPNRARVLYQTYTKALQAIDEDETVHCAAFASISTGILRFPREEAAEIAIRAVRDMVLTRPWHKKIAFVCIDNGVLTALAKAKSVMQDKLFDDLRAYP